MANVGHAAKNNARHTLKIDMPPGVRTMGQLRRVEMAAFEALPVSVRRRVDELAFDVAAWKVLLYYQSIDRQARTLGGSPHDAEVWTLRKLDTLEAADLDAFAGGYLAEYRKPLPHAAAAVTVQRYGPLVPRGRRRSLARRGMGRITMPPDIEEAAS